jgi:ribose transport system substrate-binding protein
MKKVTKRQPYSVPILMRALDILEFLRGSDIPLKPDEISNATGVSRTTTYRILHTFVLRGYVAQDPGGRFSFLSVPAKIVLTLAKGRLKRRTDG